MFRRFVLFCSFFVCFNGVCMKTVSVIMQGVTGRNLRAVVVPVNAVAESAIALRAAGVERRGVANVDLVEDGAFSIILRQDVFNPQHVNVINADGGYSFYCYR
jgi:hypothetical protein